MEEFQNKTILGKYKNFKLLGQGAISGIYYAEQISDDQPVAIKVVKTKRIQDQEQNRYYQQELDVTKAIMQQGKNENIVNILELLEGEEEYFIVTEYYQDGDLLSLLERISFSEQPEIAISFCIAIASGLNFLHKSKICHRDLKPENILIAKSNDGNFYIKISDFGISKQSDQMMKSTIGTITYMAPEILKFQDYDEKVDIWSFGCLIFEIFVGEQLFCGNSMKEVALKITSFNEDILDAYKDRIPLPVIKIIKRCLKRLAVNRISLEQIVEELLKIKAELKINMAQSMIQSLHIQTPVNRVNKEQATLAKDDAKSSNSVERESNSSHNIKFTDNMLESFIDVSVNNPEQDKSQLSQTTFDPGQSLKQSIIINEPVNHEEEEMNYITPKNNPKVDQKNIQIAGSYHSLDSDKKLRLLEEEKKNKKLEEKEKYNQFLQDQSQGNKQVSENQIINPIPQLEQSHVFEIIKNPNYTPQVGIHMYSPQPTKQTGSSSFLSDQQSLQTKVNNNNNIYSTPFQPISGNIQSNQINTSNNYLNTLNVQTKNLNIQNYNLSTQNNTYINNQYTSINNLNIYGSNNILNTQNNNLNNQKQNSLLNQSPYKISSAHNLSPLPSSHSNINKLINSPLKNLQLNDNQIQSPSFPSSLTTLPSYTQTNFLLSPRTNDQTQLPTQKIDLYSNKTQGVQNTFNADTSIQNQTHINNQSSELQLALNMFTSIKNNKKQKIQLKLNNNIIDKEYKQNSEKLKQVKNAEDEFKMDQPYQKYQFKKEFFVAIDKYIPCAKINGTEDGYILEFLSFILQSISLKNDKQEDNTPIHQYIQVILMNLNSYFYYSEFLKQNQKLLFPFFKVLLNIIESIGNKKQKQSKLFEMTMNSKFNQFLKTFGNLLQTFSSTSTQLFHLSNQKDVKQINQFIDEKKYFKMVLEHQNQNLQYLVNFDQIL